MEGMNNNQHQLRQQQSGGSPQPQQVPPQSSPQQQRPSQPKWYEPTLESKIVVVLISLAAIVVLISFAISAFSRTSGVTDFVNSDQYQAVFLSNGQVYFGEITGTTNDTMILENIYYLQVDEQIQPEQQDAAAADPEVSLAKLGNELHGPEDQMFISAKEVIFWENLREDGEVSQAIEQFEAGDEGADVDGAPQPSGPGEEGPTEDETVEDEVEAEEE